METPGSNHDAFRGSPRRNSILSASNIIQAPISTLLEYSGLFRTRPSPSQDAETLVSDDSAVISNGEVAIRIIGNGEQDAESDNNNGLRESGGHGQTPVLGSATQVDPMAAAEGASQPAPAESVAGDAASRDSPYQRYDIQQAARWIEQILPFSLLLLVVFIRQHLQGFFVAIWIAAVMFKSNDILKKQTALKGERHISALIGISLAFTAHVVGVYWWFRKDDLLFPLIMLPPKSIPPFWHAIFIIVVNDTLVRQASMIFKCFLLMYYKNSRGRNYRKQKSMDSPNPFDDSIGYVNLLNSQQDYLFPPSVAVGSSAVPLFSYPFPNDPTKPEATTPEAATVRGRRNWSPTEDVVLISGWLNTSKDALIENEQKAEAFWKRIAAYFAASPKLVGLPSREPGNCKQRWAKINDQVSKFVGCLHAENAQKASRQNDNDVMKVANEIYLNDHGAKFTLEHCWRELRNDQKWCLASSQTVHVKSKRRKLDDGSQTSQQSSSCNVDESQPSPLGVKAAKGKGKRSTISVEQGDKNLTQFQSMWEIKKQDLALKDKLSDKKLSDTLLSKTEPLTEMEMTLKEKLISDMLTG